MVPSKELILSGSNLTLLSTIGFGYISTIPPTTSPAPSSSTKAQALFMADKALFGSSPFSNLDDESVLKPNFLAESLILVPSKVALSKIIVLTLSVIFEFSPPIIPAIAKGLLASFIMSILLSNFLSCPSRVSKISPSFALSTIMLSLSIKL